MTEKAYFFYDDLEMKSEVISCTEQDDQTFHVILSSTIFHPQGGGQASDHGMIGQSMMLGAFIDENRLVHVTDRAVATGPVELSVDATTRCLHSRYHSAGHLLAHIGEKYGLLGIKGSHLLNQARVVFEPTTSDIDVTKEQLQADLAKLISDNLPRKQKFDAETRYVSWGDIPYSLCGGTHVLSTQDIGKVLITKIKRKQGLISVSYSVEI